MALLPLESCLLLLLIVPCFSMTRLDRSRLDKHLINGMEISALAFDFKPVFYTVKLPHGNYSFKDWGFDFLTWAANYFNMTVKYIIADKDKLKKDGNFKGLINELENKEADVAPMPFPASTEIFKRLSFTLPLYVCHVKFLQPYPDEESRVTALIRPYTSMVWIIFVASTLVYIGFMSFFARLKDYPGRRISAWDTVHDQFVYVVTIITLQGNSISYSVRSYVRILTAAWLLAMVVMIYAYTGLLTAMLTIQKFEPIINTWEELASSSRFRITKEVDEGILTTQLLSASSGTFKILGDEIRKDPTLFVTDIFQVTENILHRDCVFPSAIVLLNYILSEDLKSSGKCRMTISDKELPMVYLYHFGFAKGSLLAPLFDRYFMPVMEASGLTKFLDKEYLPPVNRCRVNVKKDSAPNPISLSNLIGVFFLFIIGIALSFIVFLFPSRHRIS